jgi:hypothetical protein
MMETPMTDEEKDEKKHPIDMTSDELLDYALAPEIAERLREIVRDEKPDGKDSEDVDC